MACVKSVWQVAHSSDCLDVRRFGRGEAAGRLHHARAARIHREGTEDRAPCRPLVERRSRTSPVNVAGSPRPVGCDLMADRARHAVGRQRRVAARPIGRSAGDRRSRPLPPAARAGNVVIGMWQIEHSSSMAACAVRMVEDLAPDRGLPVRIARGVGHHRRRASRAPIDTSSPVGVVRPLWQAMQLSDVWKNRCRASAFCAGLRRNRLPEHRFFRPPTATAIVHRTNTAASTLPATEAALRRTSPRGSTRAPASGAPLRALSGRPHADAHHQVLARVQRDLHLRHEVPERPARRCPSSRAASSSTIGVHVRPNMPCVKVLPRATRQNASRSAFSECRTAARRPPARAGSCRAAAPGRSDANGSKTVVFLLRPAASSPVGNMNSPPAREDGPASQAVRDGALERRARCRRRRLPTRPSSFLPHRSAAVTSIWLRAPKRFS